MVYLNQYSCVAAGSVPVTIQAVAFHCDRFCTDINEQADVSSTVHDLPGDRSISCFAFLFFRQALHHVLGKHQGYCLACAL